MKYFKSGKYVVLTAMLFSGNLAADQTEPLLNFKFNHLTNIQDSKQVIKVAPATTANELEFSQFDATWTYPWETSSMNIDLGVTLRHLSGFNNSTENVGNNYFQETFPLLHASALFSLPLKGLSAGIEGSHLDSRDRQVLDYRAKVSYEWRKGFGLQGGWQHQQFNLENAIGNGADYELKGPYLDFYLNF